jgi:hypothetical protein
MLAALKVSVSENTPFNLNIHKIQYQKVRAPTNLSTNTAKLRKWVDIVESTDSPIILMDCDTIVLKDVSHVFENDFDIAYTKRPDEVKLPLNGGVLFVRPSEPVREFFRRWMWINDKMIEDKLFHRPWKRKYEGINQASFGWMLENYNHIDITSVPCSKYNACDKVNWEALDNVHILHIKSELRSACFHSGTRFMEANRLWRKYDKLAHEVRNRKVR